MNQKGLSSMVILIIVVLGIAIAWEVSTYIDQYLNGSSSKNQNLASCKTDDPRDCDDRFDVINTDSLGNRSICKSGNAQDCNDSGDVFLFNE